MSVSVRAAAAGVLFAGAAAGIAYTLFSISRLRRFRTRLEAPRATFAPGITILKPLHGGEPRLYENLRSFCEQQYGTFQIIFGAARADDPALDAARRLQREFAHLDIVIAAGEPGEARNPKVANLMGMIGPAKYELLVIADSDIAVGPDYLQAVGAVFADPAVGAATCIFSGLPNETAVSRTGALAITDEFCPSVLVAEALAPVDFCMGATAAVRRTAFDAFGGFEAIAGCLADDYEIGQRVCGQGLRVVIAPYVVTTDVPERSLGALWSHEVRWSRTVFRARPAGYAGSVVLNYAALSAAALAASGGRPAYWVLFAAACGVRIWAHFEAGKILAPRIRPAPHLLPGRIALSFGVWCAAFSGRSVGWRGTAYEINAKGRLVDSPGNV